MQQKLGELPFENYSSVAIVGYVKSMEFKRKFSIITIQSENTMRKDFVPQLVDMQLGTSIQLVSHHTSLGKAAPASSLQSKHRYPLRY